MTKNDELPKILMHVDNSVPLFPFFDLYGTTTQIQLAGIVPAMYCPTRVVHQESELIWFFEYFMLYTFC